MKFQIVTNNPLVYENMHTQYEIVYLEIDYKEVLLKVRDMCHMGYHLLSHPLSGSVKPNETPYKSVMLSEKSADMDLSSIQLIERCIEAYEKFENLNRKWNEKVLEDFQTIDYTLISSAVESAAVN